MKIIHTIAEMQQYSREQQRNGKIIGIVPTMGYLHDGHLSLVDTARKEGASCVVVTIFVNPIQFAPNEDFDKYPRDLQRDCALLEAKNVDAVFAPSVKEMYVEEPTCLVVENKLSQGLCAKTRPTHFQGVTTVVAKLFNAVLPDIAVFGQKDAQQARVLKRMVRDLNFPIRLVISPLIREKDGLALSSRNKYLSAEERENALVLSRSLKEAKEALEKGDTSIDSAIAAIKNNIAAKGGKVDYVECVDSETLEDVREKTGREIMLVLAAYFGSTRLIDNILFTF